MPIPLYRQVQGVENDLRETSEALRRATRDMRKLEQANETVMTEKRNVELEAERAAERIDTLKNEKASLKRKVRDLELENERLARENDGLRNVRRRLDFTAQDGGSLTGRSTQRNGRR